MEDAELHALLIENSPDPQYVTDLETRRFLYVNRAFERLLGYTREVLRSEGITSDQLVAPEDRETVRQRMSQIGEDRYVFDVIARDGRRISVEVYVRRMVCRGKPMAVGVAREVTEQRRAELRLREEVSLQRHQTIGAYQANVRIYQLTEKIRAAYESTRNILKCRTLEELARETVSILCDVGGLAYQSAQFHLMEGRALRMLAVGTPDGIKGKGKKRPPRLPRLARAARERLAQVARGELSAEAIGDAQVVPLRVRGEEVTGLLVLSGTVDEQARVWQDNIVLNLAGLVALMIDNLRLYERVKAQSAIDPLTRVFNRRHLDERLADEVRRAVRYQRDLSVAMIDIDDFKRINDVHGHPQGDVILREVAKILGSWTRSTDVVCRYGGEEFLLILPETALDNAFTKMEGLRTLIASTSFANLADPERPFRITVSIGLAQVTSSVQSPERLVQTADDALYRSKRSGKDRTTKAE